MIDRYSRPAMAAIFSTEARYAHWLEIEILAVEARVEAGEVPQEDLDEIRKKASFDVARIADLERKTQHDVAAFVDNVAEIVGPAARHIHYGMTSSDVLDTALALQCRDAADLLLQGLQGLISVASELARSHISAVMAARTHGIVAEPTTFGVKVAGWVFEMDRARRRIERARAEISVGKLSGAVGIYSQLSPEVESYVCSKLGLTADPASTQVVARDRHAEFLAALAIAAAGIERIATELRHLARTEVAEVAEPFDEGGQKGSSSMPHKRNPWRSERLSGLARLVRAAFGPAAENIALWHERDISHSSVERVLIPDSCLVLDFMIAEATEILGGLKVDSKRMKANLDASGGLAFSQRVLLDLIDLGLGRDEAYRLVQEASTEVLSSGRHLREVLISSPEVASKMTKEQIEASFGEARYLEHAEQIVGRLSRLETK